jgi:putative protease
VQDLGIVRLIQRVYPELEVHGSTQMTVHDASGARVMREIGIERVVLARENTLDDVRAIREAVPDIGLETFVHGALCISYSGQCYMSGMISERSANRGACVQSCRKDYTLDDVLTGRELDRGYLISTKDLAAHDHLPALAELGVGCLKIEGRKKRPEYVATVTSGYRAWLDRLATGSGRRRASTRRSRSCRSTRAASPAGCTAGARGAATSRARSPITRASSSASSRGAGERARRRGREPLAVGDGVGFEPPAGARGAGTGLQRRRGAHVRHAGRAHAPGAGRARHRAGGLAVVRTSHAALLARARASYAALSPAARGRRARLDVRVFGSAGGPFKAVFRSGDDEVTVRSEVPLVAASKRALDVAQIRDQLGRLGETPFALAEVDAAGLAPGLFLPVSELNRLRQTAADELSLRRDWAREADLGERVVRIAAAVAAVPGAAPADPPTADDATYSVPVDPDGFGPPAFVVIGEDAGLCAGGRLRLPGRRRGLAPRSPVRAARVCVRSRRRALRGCGRRDRGCARSVPPSPGAAARPRARARRRPARARRGAPAAHADDRAPSGAPGA